MEVIEKLVKTIAKLFLILLWGVGRILEGILHFINDLLKNTIK